MLQAPEPARLLGSVRDTKLRATHPIPLSKRDSSRFDTCMSSKVPLPVDRLLREVAKGKQRALVQLIQGKAPITVSDVAELLRSLAHHPMPGVTCTVAREGMVAFPELEEPFFAVLSGLVSDLDRIRRLDSTADRERVRSVGELCRHLPESVVLLQNVNPSVRSHLLKQLTSKQQENWAKRK
eukprot:gnl/Dysnectes_brevis/4946_a6892_559.p1 GENE.gnl/Dysnectes_brevis/4946_a6892_559~~gnl/Dysnectes_brevis/4946_a6892_559.p1  ORF type:complete len:182 (-),score=65.79 gnl/Dysnectes_brevis/4946_a6892_559:134-679(-)